MTLVPPAILLPSFCPRLIGSSRFSHGVQVNGAYRTALEKGWINHEKQVSLGPCNPARAADKPYLSKCREICQGSYT